MTLLPRIISYSVAAADLAGKVICDVMSKGELGIVAKEHAKDLQTEADRAAQRCIIGSLSKYFPNIEIIGEEENEKIGSEKLVDSSEVKMLNIQPPALYTDLKEEEVVIWVDPLDGTSEYTQAFECFSSGHSGVCKMNLSCASLLDHVTVLIGIATKGKVVGGVIHQPYYNYQKPSSPLGRTMWSMVGGHIGGIEIVKPPTEEFIVATTRSHSSSTVNDAVNACTPSEVLRVGGAGHKVLLLIEGKAHAYVFASPGCKKWDTCAPQAILEAAGGKLTDIRGEDIPYDAKAQHRNSTGVLAVAAGVDHAATLKKIPQHVKDNLKAS